jgi:hypothetical protein
VDLYHAQNLRDDGGISPTVLWREFARMKVGEQGIFTLWAFKPEQQWISWQGCIAVHQTRPKVADNHPIHESIDNLRRQGLLTFVPHLWDNQRSSKSGEAEIIHSCGFGGGEKVEVDIGTAAHHAACAMLTEFKRERAIREGYTYFAPVKNTLPNVQMIGVARLRYRPHTSRTSDWFGALTRDGQRWIHEYQEMQERAENAARKTA